MGRISVFFCLILAACSSNQSNLDSFRKLNGTWVSHMENGKFVEKWKTVNDTLMTGTSYMTEGRDTLFSEDLQLILHDDTIYYIPTVSNQNDGKSIRFKLTSSSSKEWIFENKAHDFPQEILYTFKDSDSLIATVQGVKNGRSQKFEFRLKRN